MLQLVHHQHTGKVLPHHHTSYWGLLFIVLLAMGVTFGVRHIAAADADSYVVTAKVAAPLPTVAANISAPIDGARFSQPHITVEGTCQDLSPVSIIAIYAGSRLLGSAACQSTGSYQLTVDLPAGASALVARTSNATNDYGPDSDPVQVTYMAPVKPATGTTTTPATAPGASSTSSPAADTALPPGVERLRINSQSTYLQFSPNLNASWQYSLTGGLLPYTVAINWGDDTSDSYQLTDTVLQTAVHDYQHYTSKFATMTAADANGQFASFSIAAVTLFNPNLGGSGSTTAASVDGAITPFIQTPAGTLLLVYGGYVAVLGLIGLAWYDAALAPLKIAGMHLFPQSAASNSGRLRYRIGLRP